MPPDYVSTLLYLMDEYALCDRHPELATYLMLAQIGQLSQSAAMAILIQLQDLIEHYKDFPCNIHRPPAEDQWYAKAKPAIELGSLVEAPDLRFGIGLRNGQHSGFIGQTGAGKTVALRNVILKVHERNEQHPEERVSIICIDPKGGDYADIPSLLGGHWKHLSFNDGLHLGTNGPRNVPPDVWCNHFSLCRY